ncbi:MAG: DinB family protein [Acidobacteria bacterium]|nr:DinB family protein [Acidobacteriota bacterium]
MESNFLEECLPILNRTPATLNALLRDLPNVWTDANEGPDTWSPYTVLGHLIHGEQTDWFPRVKVILEHGPARTFDPYDREAQFRVTEPKSMNQLLDEFAALRQENLNQLRALNLQPEHLNLTGTHPVFGPVTLRQLLATWTTHDLAHVLQISRVMAKRYRHEVGPWAQYLSVMA